MKTDDTMNPYGVRIVMLQTTDNEVMDVLSVKNFDEKFIAHLETAEEKWAKTTDEYCDYIYNYLRNKGYQFDILSPAETAIYKSQYM